MITSKASLSSYNCYKYLQLIHLSFCVQSEQTQVFVPILVCGLILAAALIGGYVGKRHWRRKDSGMKLADESYMTDEDNQGNTLVSVAPLNPPESPEKPSQNGESLEAVKIQNPPAATNGHSTTKADTEL
ncbi:hypothetical protein PDJAM_G00075350 [Pangasius djambal]|uniref:Uncharacterized protein n=1 Tax=Pangasius djambal TaxID=1691987 RepID=A0ACC5Z3K7_9TELE|nr:hypothetical protein [Pangasius djambal]